MGPKSYLASVGPFAGAAVLASLLVAGILLVANAGGALALLAAGVILAATGFALVFDYARRAGFWNDLASYADDARHALWAMDMLERPDEPEARLAWDALLAISKAANDGVSEANRRVSDYREFVETWVHEAKSPLAAGHLMVDNLREDIAAAPLDAGSREVLTSRANGIDEELDRTEDYIEQALFYARSETLDRDYLIRTYSLHDLVVAALKDSARQLIAAHIAPQMEGLDHTVFTDEKWMRFILGQVIQNSVKYARGEGARISFTGELLDSGTAEERVALSVADNGHGVSAADLPRVFDKGFTGDAGRADEDGETGAGHRSLGGKRSTGIGLYLVKRLCDKMGVAVFAESREGAGFTVRFEFSTNKFHYFE